MTEQFTTIKLLDIFKTESKQRNLVYPLQLEDYIKSSNGDEVSFVKFRPIASKWKRPSVKEIKKPAGTGGLVDSVLEIDSANTKEEVKTVPIDSIILPIKPTVDTIVSNWQSVEGVGKALEGWQNYLKWKGLKTIMGVASSVVPSEVAIAFKSGLLGGGIDNPHDRMMYAGHERRNFDLAWEFMKPTSKKEEKILTDIFSIFRKGSLGTYGDLVIGAPITWEIEFYSFPLAKPYLRYKRCGVQPSITFGGDPGADFKAMESGMPFMSLSLTCNELDYPKEEDVELSYESDTVAQSRIDTYDSIYNKINKVAISSGTNVNLTETE